MPNSRCVCSSFTVCGHLGVCDYIKPNNIDIVTVDTSHTANLAMGPLIQEHFQGSAILTGYKEAYQRVYKQF